MRNFIIEQFYKQRSDFEKSCVEREQKYPLPDEVKCTENIAYAADDKEHRLDVYRPESMGGKGPSYCHQCSWRRSASWK